MLRPAFAILIYTITGIFIHFLSPDYNTIFLLIFIVMSLTFIIVTKYRNIIYVMLIPVALLSFYTSVNSDLCTNTQADNIAGTNIMANIKAEITDMASVSDKNIKYRIKTTHINYSNINIYDNINMFMYLDKDINILNIGDTIEFTAPYFHGDIKMNEADFDEIRYFHIQNIEYKTFPYSVTVTGHNDTLKYHIRRFSLFMQNTINELYAPKESGLMNAMILGDRNNLDDDLYNLYRDAGIVHIIAISGMHISLLAGIIFILLKPLGRYVSSAVVIVFLIFYTILTGGSASIIRSALMMGIYILSGLTGRKYDLLSSTAFSCSLLLIINPYYIFDIGFQYSYIAVFVIGFVSEIMNKYHITNKIAAGLIISIAVSLAIKPVTMRTFYYINCTDFIVNIIAVALSEFILIFGIISAVTGSFILSSGTYTAGLVYFMLKIIEHSSEFSLKFGLSHIITGTISFTDFILIYIIFFLIYKLFMQKYYMVVPLVISVILLLANTVNNNYRDFEMYCIYVGQGDCTVVRDRDKCYIFDAGSTKYKNYGDVIYNQLIYNGINKIDGIYISHTDIDHTGSIPYITDLMPVEKIYIPNNTIKNDNFDALIKAAENHNINIVYTDENYNEALTEDMSVKLVYMNKSPKSTNDSSPLYKLQYKNKSILFTGDIGESEMDKAVNYDIDCNILKVPHHGSANSLSADFITKADPDIAVSFAGVDNIYDHPSYETVEYYNSINIPFLSTNYNGMIKFRIVNDNIYCKFLTTGYKNISELN